MTPYRKHFAFYHAGDYKESYICLCSRVNNHMVSREKPVAQPSLFELSHSGEMVLEPIS